MVNFENIKDIFLFNNTFYGLSNINGLDIKGVFLRAIFTSTKGINDFPLAKAWSLITKI